MLNSDRVEPHRTSAMTASNSRSESELPSELYDLVIQVFATESKALEWLQRPHPVLGGSTPLAVTSTSIGAQRVKGVLAAIKYGGVV